MKQPTTYLGLRLRWWALLFALAVVFASWILAAGGPVLMQKPRLQSMQLVPLYDAEDKLTSLHGVTVWEVWALNPDGVSRTRHLRTIDIDLVFHARDTVPMDNEVVSLGEQTEEALILAEAIWLHRFPSRLPEERKALRLKKQLPKKQ